MKPRMAFLSVVLIGGNSRRSSKRISMDSTSWIGRQAHGRSRLSWICRAACESGCDSSTAEHR